MNTGPYSDEKVQKFIEAEFIPVKSQCFWDKRTELMKQFDIGWTPTLLVHDAKGREHHRIVGFVPAEDFLAHLKLGKGKMFFDRFRFAEAIEAFTAVVEQHAGSGPAPEAIFFLGVAKYWKSHDPKGLRWAYDTLTARFPQSEWCRRAQPYKQISP
jgi:Thioredoxin-like domain